MNSTIYAFVDNETVSTIIYIPFYLDIDRIIETVAYGTNKHRHMGAENESRDVLRTYDCKGNTNFYLLVTIFFFFKLLKQIKKIKQC